MTRPAQPTDLQTTESPTRLRSIDALRGAAALAVVLYHAVGNLPGDGGGGALARAAGAAVRFAAAYGYVGVFLFFVISGFCIHLNHAKARASGRDPSVGFASFWRRRVRRLYPPYLVALALSLAVAAATIGLPRTRLFAWDVVSHLLMLHNFDPRTCYSISSVFWTLAVEEQLYLAYFVLLYARRRWGWAVTLGLCFAARIAWFAAGELLREKAGVNLPVTESAAVHWLTWALGALAVESAFGLVSLPRWTRDLRVGALALAAAAALAHVQDVRDVSRPLHDAAWLLLHPAWGFGFFVLLNRAVFAEQGRAARRGPSRAAAPLAPSHAAPLAPSRAAPLASAGVAHLAPSLVSRLASAGVASLAAAGVVSYSLYLTHPVVLLFAWRFDGPRLSPLAVRLFVMTPLCLAFAWLFFRLFERPFLTRGAGRGARGPSEAPRAPRADALPAEVVAAEV